MLWLIAALLAAILVAMLGALGIRPTVLAAIVGVALWIFLAALAAHHFGDTGVWVVLALPFAAAGVGSLVVVARDAGRKPPTISHDPVGKATERTRGEFFRRSKEIEDRARR